MDELIFAPIRAEDNAERQAQEKNKKSKEPKKAEAKDESKDATKSDKDKSTASELSLDEDKENKDQNVKGRRKQPAITVNDLLEQKSIVNEDLLKKELDDTFDVDVEGGHEVGGNVDQYTRSRY